MPWQWFPEVKAQHWRRRKPWLASIRQPDGSEAYVILQASSVTEFLRKLDPPAGARLRVQLHPNREAHQVSQ